MPEGSFLPPILEACTAQSRAWVVGSGNDVIWLDVRPTDAAAELPAQGWKLHVSAGLCSALEVLDASLPVLLREGAVFKVAASMEALWYLNCGRGGLSQVGKFITVYPADDTVALRLATGLELATSELRGPVVMSDVPLRTASLVHYRYGRFRSDCQLQRASGAIVPGIVGSGNRLMADSRLPFAWTGRPGLDPFRRAGIAIAQEQPGLRAVGAHYRVVRQLRQTAGGRVLVAEDMRDGQRRVVKEARRDALLRHDGLDARDLLRAEAELLQRLEDTGAVPSVCDLFDESDNLYLVLELITGSTIAEFASAGHGVGVLPSLDQVVAVGASTCLALDAVHSCGLTHGDLSKTNVLVGADLGVRLIDLDPGGANQPRRADHDPVSYGSGTPGYRSPARASQAGPTVQDDIYSIGALLYFLTGGADLRIAGDRLDLSARPIEALRPSSSRELSELIGWCLEARPEDRPASVAEILAGLDTVVSPPDRPARKARNGVSRLGRFATAAQQAGRDLARLLEERVLERDRGRAAILSPDVGHGISGVVIALAALADVFPAVFRSDLEVAADRLRNAARPGGAQMPGLYFGDCGVATVMVRAGRLLGDDDLTELGVNRAHAAAALPYSCPDIMVGSAGRLRAHLWLASVTVDQRQLAAATAAGDSLHANTEWPEPHIACWRIGPGFDELSHKRYLGYAHGAAGIADALLDAFVVVGDERYLELALAAAKWISRQAIPALVDGSGVTWPRVPRGPATGTAWCHGASGIGRFLLRLGAIAGVDGFEELAMRAGLAVALGSRWQGPGRCHGLAASVEFLLDLYLYTRDDQWLQWATELGDLLMPFCSSEHADPFADPVDISYLNGLSGIILALLRLSDPLRVVDPLGGVGADREQFEAPKKRSSASWTASSVLLT